MLLAHSCSPVLVLSNSYSLPWRLCLSSSDNHKSFKLVSCRFSFVLQTGLAVLGAASVNAYAQQLSTQQLSTLFIIQLSCSPASHSLALNAWSWSIWHALYYRHLVQLVLLLSDLVYMNVDMFFLIPFYTCVRSLTVRLAISHGNCFWHFRWNFSNVLCGKAQQ